MKRRNFFTTLLGVIGVATVAKAKPEPELYPPVNLLEKSELPAGAWPFIWSKEGLKNKGRPFHEFQVWQLTGSPFTTVRRKAYQVRTYAGGLVTFRWAEESAEWSPWQFADDSQKADIGCMMMRNGWKTLTVFEQPTYETLL